MNEELFFLGGIPQELVLLSKEGMMDDGMVGVVGVGWMLVTEMLGWMVLVWCYTLHRAEALCWVMSPYRALDNPEGVL